MYIGTRDGRGWEANEKEAENQSEETEIQNLPSSSGLTKNSTAKNGNQAKKPRLFTIHFF
jgi:hypothetical protein